MSHASETQTIIFYFNKCRVYSQWFCLVIFHQIVWKFTAHTPACVILCMYAYYGHQVYGAQSHTFLNRHSLSGRILPRLWLAGGNSVPSFPWQPRSCMDIPPSAFLPGLFCLSLASTHACFGQFDFCFLELLKYIPRHFIMTPKY